MRDSPVRGRHVNKNKAPKSTMLSVDREDPNETSYSLLNGEPVGSNRTSNRSSSGTTRSFTDDNMRIFSQREMRRASIMHRLTDKKFSLREKIMATFMFILSAVLVFIIYKTNSISALGVNSYSGQDKNICNSKPCIELSANILASLSETVEPCDDFFEFACENWIKAYPMPKGKSTWGTLHKRSERTSYEVKHILESDEDPSIVPYGANLRRIYEACMDTEEVDQQGARPAQAFITDNFAGWSWDRKNGPIPFPKIVEIGHKLGNAPFFGFGVGTDLQDSNKHLLSFDQDGLSFMNRDYYINKTDGKPIDFENVECELKFYHDYMSKVIKLLSPDRIESEIKVDTAKILKFEQKLAGIMMTIEQARDFSNNYQDISIGELMNITTIPDFNWLKFLNSFFTDEKIEDTERIALYARDYFHQLPKLIQDEDPNVIHNYVTWISTKPLIYTLSDNFQKLRYDLVYSVQGVDLSCNERWRICTEYARDSLPLIVGRFYVETYFNDDTKRQVSQFANSIKKSFVDVLKEQDWMDDTTKKAALDKADKMTDKYGFPTYILNDTRIYKEYDGLKLESGDFWNFTQEISQWAIKKHLSKLRQPVDKELWAMPVEETNAYYSPTDNSMVFPAGILQPPLYHPEYPDGFNYGAIGMIIGHEITHGFDDQGRHMGANGNMNNWWGDVTASNFAERTKCMENQYSQLEYAGMKLNGKLTLGENIADNGGIKIAYQAWKRSPTYEEELSLPGLQNFTTEQAFFLAQAQTWCSVTLDKAAINQMKMDPHPPNKLRVNQGMRNFKPFAEVWNCPVGSNMNPVDRCNLW